MEMKNLAFCLATCGLFFAGCSSNDVYEENKDRGSQDVITFNANTTRAGINGLKEVKSGFPVYATSGNNAAWYIAGSNNIYKDFDGKWDWSNGNTQAQNAHKWPTVTNGYPMSFYAYFPKEAAGFAVNTTTVGTVTAIITIEADPASQTDFLAANYENVTTKPASGKLNLKFGHITSKVNFGIIAGNGADVFVQQVHINKVGNSGTYRYNSVTTGGNSDPAKWTSSLTGGYEGMYKYFPTVTVPSPTEALPVFKPSTADESTNNPVYTETHNRHLMLRPQTKTETWSGAKPSPVVAQITPDKAYIESVYRIQANGDDNAVGYKDASNHPDFESLTEDKRVALRGKPLYIKVGFPLGDPLTWEQGKGYMYKLKLGTVDATGGIIIDDNYYDEKGNRTDLTIKDKEPGDPVNDGNIHFNVDVTEWEEDIDGNITQ